MDHRTTFGDRRSITRSVFTLLVLFAAEASVAAAVKATWILKDVETSRANYNSFSTPIAEKDGRVYVVTVAPGNSGVKRINDHTVVHRGTRSVTGWRWQSKVIERRTLDDRYHTGGSLALDREGYVHVAYNLHNMPWQYSVSRSPHSIDAFEFRGERVTMDELKRLKFENKTVFPNLGTADIPGTQVTYPMFFNDRQGALYVTYRYALRPGRSWLKRIFAGGVARYDERQRRWTAIGGSYPLGTRDANDPKGVGMTQPLVYEPGWWVYGVTLAFDVQNNMHVSWQWREGGAGGATYHPMYMWSPDGGRSFLSVAGKSLNLPVRKSDLVPLHHHDSGYLFPARVTAHEPGKAWVHLKEKGGQRGVVRYQQANNRWQPLDVLPHASGRFMIDRRGRQWAFASGPKVFRRSSETADWEKVYQSSGYCGARPVETDRGFAIYTWDCKSERVAVLLLENQ